MRPCSIYLHDPGRRFNDEAPAVPGQLRADSEASYSNAAYWLHRAILGLPRAGMLRRSDDPTNASIIFVAHYFLLENPESRPGFFGAPLLGWASHLQRGAQGLFGNGTLLGRWRRSSSDFLIAPPMYSCKAINRNARWLRGARWVILDPSCGYRDGFDVMAPYVLAGSEWSPTRAAPQREAAPRPLLLLYIGRLGKAYVNPPATLLRSKLWAALRRHPNTTFLATDVSTALAPYTSWPQERCSAAKCHKSHCQHCVDLAPDDDLSTGSARRVSSSEYRQLMGRATFCLVLSGDMPGRDVGESEVELQPINTSTRATESHNTPSLHH